MQKKDFYFKGVKLLQEKGKSVVYYDERIVIKNESGENEEKYIYTTCMPPYFPHDDLKMEFKRLIPLYAKMCKRHESEVRVTYLGIEKKKENMIYVLRGVVREPAGYYNSYNPHKLNEKLREYYDENNILHKIAEKIIKETFDWVTGKKNSNSNIQRLWEEEDLKIAHEGIPIEGISDILMEEDVSFETETQIESEPESES